MALTEKEKKHIEEEEAYRAKIREEAQSKNQPTSQPKKGMSGCLVVFLLFAAVIAITLLAINPAKQFETAEKNAQATPVLEINNGSFTTPTGEVYSFEITFEEGDGGDNKYVASYTPFLKNNDSTLMMAIFEAFKTAYGNDGRLVPTPILEERNGTNLIKFTGDVQDYYVMPIKEDTGEIHTLMFWKE
jgi:hypothetical protein